MRAGTAPGGGTLEGVHDLIAVLLPAGPDLVETLERIWARGDAVLPLDPGAPRVHTEGLLDALAPAAVIDVHGESRRGRGLPVEEGDAVVVATSGTTGAPKGAVHTHAGLAHAAAASARGARSDASSRWLACLPLSHVAGFSVLTRALLTGAGLEVHPRFDASAVERARRQGATHVSLVPTALARIDPTGWTTILLGGSAIPEDRPGNCIATYGMTETFGGVVYDGLPLEDTEVRVTEGGSPVEPGAVGVIELRTPSIARCYRDGTPVAGGDGWYRTGDLGSLDPATGALRVHGRADDLIITGGEKVWPGPVEAVLGSDPAVREVAVLGEPDPEWGERVVAVVVPAPGATPRLDALRDLVRSRLPVAAAPKELRLVDSLPRTGLGKIRRSSLMRTDSQEPDNG